MCGIAGIFVNDPARLATADLQRLADGLEHRGPDGEGLWTSLDGKAGLVHRRLAIIDTTKRGDQPMHTGDGAYSMVFNGEIYNFLELRAELERLGSRFSSDSDSEVVLQAWHQWGADMLQRFNGMWAIVIRDNRSGDVFIARDRFGVKPLLYSHGAGFFAFASEMRALQALPQVSRAIDVPVLQRLLFDPFSIEGSASTLVGSISRLPAGHCGWLRGGRLDVRRWWRTTDHLVEVPASAAEQAERFRELFFDAIRLRMRSDVSIGTCLSGGFDSSAIACAMAQVAADAQSHQREAHDWRHAFIASFPGQSNDETPEALEAADYAQVRPHVLRFDDQDPVAQIDRILEDLDDIYISLPTAPWQIYRELRRHRTLVSLDGHGADELMGAYRQAGQAFGFELRNQAAKMAQGSPGIQRAIEHSKAAWLSTRGMAFLRGHRFSAPRALALHTDTDELPAHWGPLNRRLYRMFHGTVLPTILRNFDRMSMAHGVEVRMPFMDWRLVSYVMSLPDEAKNQDGRTKAVARLAMVGRMPEGIRAGRRKVGFNSPMPEWLNGGLGVWSQAVLARPNAAFDAIVEAPRLRERVRGLTQARAWQWEAVGRLWPYIHAKWMLDRQERVA